MSIYTFDTKQKCTFDSSILTILPVTAENRFGASLDLINSFRDKLLSATRNGQLIRARWEIEWQSEEVSSKANQFLREALANKVSDIDVSILKYIKPYTVGNCSSRVNKDRTKTNSITVDLSDEETSTIKSFSWLHEHILR